MELLNLTIGDPSAKPAEFEVEFFKGEQRKIYRDEISPLTDEERKILQAKSSDKGCAIFFIVVAAAISGFLFFYFREDVRFAALSSLIIAAGAFVVFLLGRFSNDDRKKLMMADGKRILIAPVLKKERGSRNSLSQTTHHYTILHFSDKKRTIYQNSLELHDIEERDMVEIHFAQNPNVAPVAILQPIKVASFKRERPKIEDLKRQVFFKDEIVPLTEEDKEKIEKKAGAAKGCTVFLAVPSVAFAVYWFFYSSNETAWRFVFGGVGVLLAILCAAAWLVVRWGSKDEIKINKKRVITAPIAELFTRTVFGKPTKFYAAIKTAAETLEREIPAETYLDLEPGDIIELEFMIDPNSETTLRELTKIANAPEAKNTETDLAETRKI